VAEPVSTETNAKISAFSEPIIEFRQVEYQIDIALPPRPILSGVSLSIHRGETVALLGPSGSGKTTLLKLINGLRRSTSGSVRVHGREVGDWNPIQLRRGIGYVIQEVGLFPHLSVRENVCLVPELENWAHQRIQTRFAEVMQSVGLNPQEFAQRYPRQLSGGQKQRVGVARALAADPPILLMDEPFGALDPVTRADLQREFLGLARKMSKTIVLVTHDVREALLLGTRIALVDAGSIVAEATCAQFPHLDHPLARQFLAAAELTTGARC